MEKRKLLVFGTGAVGGYYGGMLVKAGFDVTFVARGKNYEALKKNGLTLIREDKKEIIPIKVFDDTKGLGIFDYIFICTKARDTKKIIEKIKQNVNNKTRIISFQNGVENEEIIATVIGKEKVIGANLYINSWLVEPGVVEVLGSYYITIGALNGMETPQVKELQEIFQLAEVRCNISSDITAELWHKLVWNAAVNPISVLTKKTIDEILNDQKLFDLVKNIMMEVKDVALANGINIRRDTVEYNLECSKNYKRGIITSMLQDYEKGNPIELEEIVGVVIRKAKEKNIDVSCLERVYNDLLKLIGAYA